MKKTKTVKHMRELDNGASWIRTSEYSSQSAVPYRLAIAL